MSSALQEKYCGVQSPFTGTTMERTLGAEDGEVTFTRKKLKKFDVEAIDNPESLASHTNVHNLPPELLMEIFSCFSVRELCLTISPVCKMWHLFSRHQCLWKHLSFKGRHVTTEDICLLLSHATQLQSLQLVKREDATAVLRQAARSNRRIQILIVKDCRGSLQTSPIPEDVLLKLIQSCCKLVSVTIKRSQFYSETFFNVMAIALPDLKRINFNGNRYFGSRSLNIIACNCKPLEEVRVCWNKNFRTDYPDFDEKYIKDNDIIELCTRMKHSLKILKVNATKLTNCAVESIVQCTFLNTLSMIHATHLSDDGILLLTTLPNISSLRFTGAHGVSSEGWHELFVRSKWKSLRKLYLASCSGVNDNVLEIIARNYTNLQSINLSNCANFTENGLSKLIKECNQLIFLSLYFLPMNVCQCFPIIPTYIPNLRRLIYFNWLHDVEELILEGGRQILDDLQKKLPNLEIDTNIFEF